MSYKYLRLLGCMDFPPRALDILSEVRVPHRSQRDEVHRAPEELLQDLEQTEVCVRVLSDGQLLELDQEVYVAAPGLEPPPATA
jgi:hypothetical protein